MPNDPITHSNADTLEIIILTDAAIKKASILIQAENQPNTMLRIYITGGGCSGFQYGFTLDNQQAQEDTIITKKGAQFVIDPMSLQYLMGSTVDYVEELLGSRFIIHNPLASSTCGCGASFSI
ncbi:MAG: iron-sulfur cluster insertion protein ErpA [Endozoicomonadaceae bacterium]|nr:iron-sulfur cluster insertion protein ErpA [Endozoicomonadaceae bacterium]MBE8232805.1 iron-sulfur cluster insertion protein ErpA [Endozoicomonadaceae bacterium]